MSVYRHSLAALLCTAFTTLPAYAEADRTIALILDSSGSMKAALPDGQTRMEAAKAAVAEFVSTLPPDTRLAFRAYGHQSPTSKKDCKDTSLLTGFDAVSANKAAIIDQARGLRPQGYTPITYSLTLAAQDLLAEEAAAHVVVLVSDGKETCEADPCAAAKALAEADAKLVVHTVGVGVDTVTRSQLQCIARMARGSYFDANSTSELTGVLSKAAVRGQQRPLRHGTGQGKSQLKTAEGNGYDSAYELYRDGDHVLYLDPRDQCNSLLADRVRRGQPAQSVRVYDSRFTATAD